MKAKGNLVWTADVQPFHDKGPRPLLWIGSRATYLTLSGMVYLTA